MDVMDNPMCWDYSMLRIKYNVLRRSRMNFEKVTGALGVCSNAIQGPSFACTSYVKLSWKVHLEGDLIFKISEREQRW